MRIRVNPDSPLAKFQATQQKLQGDLNAIKTNFSGAVYITPHAEGVKIYEGCPEDTEYAAHKSSIYIDAERASWLVRQLVRIFDFNKEDL